jgi:hypothetical protein
MHDLVVDGMLPPSHSQSHHHMHTFWHTFHLHLENVKVSADYPHCWSYLLLADNGRGQLARVTCHHHTLSSSGERDECCRLGGLSIGRASKGRKFIAYQGDTPQQEEVFCCRAAAPGHVIELRPGKAPLFSACDA